MSNEFDPTSMPSGNIKQLDDDWKEPDKHEEIPTTRKRDPNVNPLQKYFRSSGITINLPSQGYWYPNSDIQYSISGELEVLPMTASDEVLFKNPDAVMSGRAVENVIQSCVPGITYPREIVQADVDAIMMAIRASTYGEDYEIAVKCPECKVENTYNLDIRNLIGLIKPLDPPYSVMMQDLKVFVKQYDLASIFTAQQSAFKESKKIEHFTRLEQEGEDLGTMEAFGETMDIIHNVKKMLSIKSITHIVLPDGEIVSSQNDITGFMENGSAKDIKIITDKIDKVTALESIPTTHGVECIKCKHEWDIPLDFNPANFS